jgi:hypothetical protein
MIAEGQTATNPQTGHRVMFKGGQWVDLGSAQMQAKAPPHDQQLLDELTKELSEKQMLAQRANEFMQLNKKTATGPGYGEVHVPFMGSFSPGEWAQNFLDQKGAANRQQMESINNQTWVNMRPAGSGAMRMPEVHGFQQAFPNVTNFGTANQEIAHRLNDEAQQVAQKMNYVQQFVRAGKGTATDALAAWTAATGNAPPSQQQPQGQAMPGQPPQPMPLQQGAVAQPPAPQAGFKILSVE